MLSQGRWVYPQWLSDQKSIVEPDAFSGTVEVEDAILCFSVNLFSQLAEAFDLDDESEEARFSGALRVRSNDKIALFQGYFGAPAAGMLMEALIASGVKRFLMVGEAGSISPKCTIGDLFLPSWGVREEGTSYHYLPPNDWCEVTVELHKVIRGYFKEAEFVEGGVWTTDAPFRETMDKVHRYSEKGVMAVEMECSALMAIALYRDVSFAAALVITDELFSGNWVQGFKNERVSRRQSFLCQTLADRFYREGGFL